MVEQTTTILPHYLLIWHITGMTIGLIAYIFVELRADGVRPTRQASLTSGSR